jgi:hypothetical protein
MKIKNTLSKIIVPICLMFTVALVTGCASPNPNAGQVTVTTNPATGVTTTNVAPEYLPNQTVTGIVSTASQIAPLVPAPYGTALTALLGLTTVVLGGIAGWKNNQANGLTAQLTSVIQGVESATTDATTGANITTVSGAAVKASIASHAKAAGVQPALNANVQKITS